MSSIRTYTFGIAKAYVSANGDTSQAASWVEIPIVGEGSVEYTVQKVEVADGEGKLQITWRHGQRARVALRMKQYAFNILERITGSPVSSANGVDMQYFGRDEEISPPFVRLKLVQKAVDNSNAEGYFTVVIFKAQGEMPSIQMREVTAGEFQVNFDSLVATRDDAGALIPSSLFKVTALDSSA